MRAARQLKLGQLVSGRLATKTECNQATRHTGRLVLAGYRILGGERIFVRCQPGAKAGRIGWARVVVGGVSGLTW